MKPTKNQIKTAEIMLRFAMHSGNGWEDCTVEKCREIVEYLAEEEFFEQTAEWKNRMLFSLTGSDSVCNYRDE